MAELTVDRLKDILRVSAGEDESIRLDRDIADVPFSALGYDSLALLETAALIKREYGVDTTDDITELETPAALVGFVNAKLVAAA